MSNPTSFERRAAKRARRLAELENVLADCRRMIATIDTDCPEAAALRQRIARASHELDRQRGLMAAHELPATEKARLRHELACWSGNFVADAEGNTLPQSDDR